MEHSSFWNSVNGDRKYKSEDWDLHLSPLITNGVFMNPAENLQVTADGTDMYVSVQAGPAELNGKRYTNDSPLAIPIDVADGALDRIDRIVIRSATASRDIHAVIKKGQYASSPTAPDLQRDADAYELGLADVYVAAGATTIAQANITDLRLNSDLCGIVSIVPPFDTTAFWAQMQDWITTNETNFTQSFNTWFAGIKNSLGSDAAGNLLNLINALAGTGRTTETVKANADAITSLAGSGRTTETVKANADAIKLKLNAKGDTIVGYSEALTVLSPTSGIATLDLSLSNVFDVSITVNTTFMFSNPVASGKVSSFTIMLRPNASSITWPSTVKWPSDVIPTFTSGKVHLLSFVTDNGGLRWYGTSVTNFTT